MPAIIPYLIQRQKSKNDMFLTYLVNGEIDFKGGNNAYHLSLFLNILTYKIINANLI